MKLNMKSNMKPNMNLNQNSISKTTHSFLGLIGLMTLLAASLAQPLDAKPNGKKGKRWVPVSGTGIHYFSTSIQHSSTPTPTGKIDRNTDVIDLFGDLNGRVLYHVTSETDFVAGKMRNTGHQVFSGTILDSEPVLMLDDEFVFNVDFASGETVGEVFLTRRLAGEKIKCELTVIGTGFDENGNGLAEYTGRCKRTGKFKR